MKGYLYWLTIMWIVCETLYLYGYSKNVLVEVHVRTHMNIRLAHGLVDDYISQVMDMEMSN